MLTATTAARMAICMATNRRLSLARVLDIGERALVDEIDEVADGSHDPALLVEIGVVDESLVLRRDIRGIGAIDTGGDTFLDAVHHVELELGEPVRRTQRRAERLELAGREVGGAHLIDE